jgi:hypothetical protein
MVKIMLLGKNFEAYLSHEPQMISDKEFMPPPQCMPDECKKERYYSSISRFLHGSQT